MQIRPDRFPRKAYVRPHLDHEGPKASGELPQQQSCWEAPALEQVEGVERARAPLGRVGFVHRCQSGA
eukprot:15430954-Alexandrium_andersonii.AAC.1